MKNSYLFTVARISLSLLLICAVVAGVVAFVNDFTYEAYENNLKEIQKQAISKIFKDSDTDESVIDYETMLNVPEGINAIHIVSKNSEDAGYCVNLNGKGFGGSFELMVGYNEDGTLKGISVVSHSETPGVGTKVVESDDFLAQYTGKSGELTVSKKAGADIVAVSGATISSKAVTAAINKANAAIAYLKTLESGVIPSEGGIEQ